ncbi:MAG TPA: hypothetical protein VKI62_00755 [Bacteroidota bacterium]|nr:hypothetical protein [Bacteroidota bacterium]
MGLFDSQASDAASQLGGQYQSLINSILGQKNPYGSGGATLGGVEQQFGLPSGDLSSIFNPQRSALASANAGQNRQAAAREGSSVTPEFSFAAPSAAYTQGLASLGAAQGQAEQQQGNFNANFLDRILGQQGQFNMSKFGLADSALGGEQSNISNLDNTSIFSGALDIGSIIAKAFGGGK